MLPGIRNSLLHIVPARYVPTPCSKFGECQGSFFLVPPSRLPSLSIIFVVVMLLEVIDLLHLHFEVYIRHVTTHSSECNSNVLHATASGFTSLDRH